MILLSKFLKNNNGGSLLSVLIISLWIYIILIILISVTFMQYRAIQVKGHRVKAHYLALAGIHRVMSKPITGILYNQRFNNISFHRGQALVERRRWGGYWRYDSIGEYGRQRIGIRVLHGQYIPEALKSAVILGQQKYPLILSGSSSVKGACYTGPGGVRDGVINGERFGGDFPLERFIHAGKQMALPPFDTTHCRKALRDLKQCARKSTGKKYFSSLYIQEKTQLSKLDSSAVFVKGSIEIGPFASPVFVPACTLAATGSISIHRNVYFPEWTVLYSDESVNLAGGVWKNALIASQGILHIEGPTRGSLQAFSQYRIVVNGPVELNWPSMIVVDSGNKDYETTLIDVSGHVFVCGSIILLDRIKKEEKPGRNLIKFGKGVKIHGIIYTPAWCCFGGDLNGCLACGAVWLYRSPTTYINWLYNAHINAKRLEDDFIVPLGFKPSRPVLFEKTTFSK